MDSLNWYGSNRKKDGVGDRQGMQAGRKTDTYRQRSDTQKGGVGNSHGRHAGRKIENGQTVRRTGSQTDRKACLGTGMEGTGRLERSH